MYKAYQINSHNDIELGIDRKPIDYFITFPDLALDLETGLIFSICGYGDVAESNYQLDKLCPYLANKYNCIVVTVNYFGIDRVPAGMQIDVEGLINTARITQGYSETDQLVDGKTRLDNFLLWLKRRGINVMGGHMQQYMLIQTPEYNSFGFLPAIDHLIVLGKILTEYKINSKKIIAFGSSYGGYIANLLGKFAPNTFSVIIDNSGFSRTRLGDMLNKEIWLLGGHRHKFDINENESIDVVFVDDYPWTIIDEDSPYYFSDSCRSIRSLLRKEHRIKSGSRYYIFHSVDDTVIAPIIEKDKLVELLKMYNDVYYKRVTNLDVDGKIFKTTEHGMRASLRGLFDMVAQINDSDFNKRSGKNDFILNSKHIFKCGKKDYIFEYNDRYEVRVFVKDAIM